MNREQLQAVKVGDAVRWRGMWDKRGVVTLAAATWFIVKWENGDPETVSRNTSHKTEVLYIDGAPNREQRRAHLQHAPAAPIRAYKDD